jgi:hypothetical protein
MMRSERRVKTLPVRKACNCAVCEDKKHTWNWTDHMDTKMVGELTSSYLTIGR